MIYIAIGQVAGTALEKKLSPIIVANDNLLIGASRIDVRRHRMARRRHWGSAPSREFDAHLASGAKDPICVVAPPTVNALLSLCRVCSSAAETGREVHVMDLAAGASGGAPVGIDPAREVYLDVGRIARRLPETARWSSLQVAVAATLWRLWCRRSPVAISRFCSSAGSLHAQLANLACYHAGFFPRVTERGLSLSRMDELILRQLSHEWISPARLYANAMASSSPLGAWLSHTGDLYVAARLREWSSHSQGKIVEQRTEIPPRSSEMVAASFRWSAGSEAILDDLPALQSAPPVFLGGAVAYDSRHPWACRVDKTGIPYLTRRAT